MKSYWETNLTLKRKRKLVSLLVLSYRCIATINVLWLFLAVPWVGLQCVIVVFPDHTHLLLDIKKGQGQPKISLRSAFEHAMLDPHPECYTPSPNAISLLVLENIIYCIVAL